MSYDLATLGEVFAETWRAYKLRLWTVLGVVIIGSGIMLVAAMLSGMVASEAFQYFASLDIKQIQDYRVDQIFLVLPLCFVLSLPVVLTFMWVLTAVLVVVVDEEYGIFDGIAAGLGYFFPMIWVTFMLWGVCAGLLLVGALFSFALSLSGFNAVWLQGLAMKLVPLFCLIVTVVYFGFAFFVMIDEDKRGIDALLVSLQYVRGLWWNTLGRFVVVALLSLPFLLVWLAILSRMVLLPVYMVIIAGFVQFLFIPFLLLFIACMYHDVKDAKGGEASEPGILAKAIWGSAIFLGLALPVTALGAMSSHPNEVRELVRLVSERGQAIIAARWAAMEKNEPVAGPALELSTAVEADAEPDVATEQSAAEPVETSGDVVARNVEQADTWNDPVGDVIEQGSGQWLDIVAVAAHGRDGFLELSVELNNDFSDFYENASATQPIGRLVGFYLDSDVDRATGGKTSGGDGRSGYEIAINVMLEAVADKSARPVYVSMSMKEARRTRSLGNLDRQHIVVNGKKMLIRLPLADLGLKSGDLLRLCYCEFSQKDGAGLAKDQIITL